MSSISQNSLPNQAANSPQLQGIDYVEFYVGNAYQAAHFYRTVYGFTPIAYAGLETGVRDYASYILQRDECYFVITSPLGSDGPVAEYVQRHGDGIKDIAFRVDNVHQAFTTAVQHGARPLLEPTISTGESGSLLKASIASFGDTVHSFIQRDSFEPPYLHLPGYRKIEATLAPWTGLHLIDHFAVSLPYGELQQWVNFYTQVLGFHQIHEEGIMTEYSAMSSIAVQDSTDRIKFVLIEPVPGKRTSQIEEFLSFHQGAGVQHIALHSQDIIKSVKALEANGVRFVSAPDSYYAMLPDRVGSISEDIALLQDVNVLVDRDEWGYLLQIFSAPIQNRPTLFIELIQRKNARGFGSGNIQALFKALEREQAKRGNL